MSRESSDPEGDAPVAVRLNAEDRKQSLIDAAAQILAHSGVDAVRMPEVAEAAGVTRPIVYKHFENRHALIIGVLEDFRGALGVRTADALRGWRTERWEVTVRRVIEATCDVLEDRGPAAWHLLGTGAPDPVVEEVAHEVRDGILEPWLATVSEVTGGSKEQSRVLCLMTIGVVRGGLSQWLSGALSRERAIDLSTRGVCAMVRDARTHSSAA